MNTKLEKQLHSSKIDKSNKNKPPSTNNPPIELHNLADKQKRIQGRKQKKNRRYLKLQDYLTKCQNKYDKCDDSNYVVNLSSVDLSEAEIKLLSKGLSFCPTPGKVDWIELKADVEDFSHRLHLKEYFYGHESVPIHFNQPKHTINDVQVIPLLHVNSNRDSIHFSMEQHLIDKAGTLQNGINRTCDH